MADQLKSKHFNRNFEFVVQLIKETHHNVYKTVNTQIIDLYWEIGHYLYTQNTWGKSVVKELAAFIKLKHPNIKGFSAQNLWRMKQFYESYKDHNKLSTLLREVSWSHNMAILACNTIEEKRSFRELQRKMEELT